ncbi:hypothetical protein HAX54_032108 [Datura stramonium]|uniref:Uncharacterized protein n=1 Tax=Datura stramonium TaxID=4076 RepID=A0ABS8VDH9_DATST|nr:hypothetical protein [Datura stramonium]
MALSYEVEHGMLRYYRVLCMLRHCTRLLDNIGHRGKNLLTSHRLYGEKWPVQRSGRGAVVGFAFSSP